MTGSTSSSGSPKTASQTNPHRLQEPGLLLRRQTGVGEPLQIALKRKENMASSSRAESLTIAPTAPHVSIRPDQPEDIKRLFEIATDTDQAPCRGIVHLWSLDASLPEDATATAMEASQTLGCINALQVVREMAGAQWREPPRLWLVTLRRAVRGRRL